MCLSFPVILRPQEINLLLLCINHIVKLPRILLGPNPSSSHFFVVLREFKDCFSQLGNITRLIWVNSARVCVRHETNLHSNASHSCALAQMTSYSLPFVVIVFWTSSVATQLLFVAQQSA